MNLLLMTLLGCTHGLRAWKLHFYHDRAVLSKLCQVPAVLCNTGHNNIDIESIVAKYSESYLVPKVPVKNTATYNLVRTQPLSHSASTVGS